MVETNTQYLFVQKINRQATVLKEHQIDGIFSREDYNTVVQHSDAYLDRWL